MPDESPYQDQAQQYNDLSSVCIFYSCYTRVKILSFVRRFIIKLGGDGDEREINADAKTGYSRESS